MGFKRPAHVVFERPMVNYHLMGRSKIILLVLLSSSHSTSLDRKERKKKRTMDSYGKIYPLTNPWIIITSAFAVCGWLIAFVGACVAALHHVAWWIIIFELFFTVGIIVALGLGGFGPHRGTVCRYLLYTTCSQACNSLYNIFHGM
ncbi:hypothetical protein BX666DRAFT_972738 [Dichotomocladium elegans]|nr:hypothetical protein BX666DRAFT_972738 [Dichotomocladium elegans]